MGDWHEQLQRLRARLPEGAATPPPPLEHEGAADVAEATKTWMAEATKICPKCHEVKPVSGFSRNRCSRDGLQSWCKECHSEAVRTIYRRARTAKRRAAAKSVREPVVRAPVPVSVPVLELGGGAEPYTLELLARAFSTLLEARRITGNGFVADFCDEAMREIRRAMRCCIGE